MLGDKNQWAARALKKRHISRLDDNLVGTFLGTAHAGRIERGRCRGLSGMFMAARQATSTQPQRPKKWEEDKNKKRPKDIEFYPQWFWRVPATLTGFFSLGLLDALASLETTQVIKSVGE